MNEFLSIKEAMVFADIFDRIGESHNADVMDDYIQKVSQLDGDLIKQAGLFRNMLRRLVGFGKKIFFKVYRELYDKAEETQKLIDERIKEINERYDNIKKDLKNHDLEGWRGGIYALKLSDSKNIMSGFDSAYGKLVQYLGITGESEGKEVGEKSQIEKLPNVVPDETESETGSSEEVFPEYWTRMTPGAEEGWTEVSKNVAFNPSQGSLRLDNKYFNYILGKHLYTDGIGNVKYYSNYTTQKQPMGGKLKELMGEDEWEMKQDGDYVYLMPKTRGTPAGAPPVKTPEVEEEVEFKTPELPKPEVEKTRKPAEEETLEETEVEEETETPEETEVEEETETPEEVSQEGEEIRVIEPDKKTNFLSKTSPKERVWYKARHQIRNIGEGNMSGYVYRNVLKSTAKRNNAEIVEDPKLIDFLNKAVSKDFLGHKANVSNIWIPSNATERKRFMDVVSKDIEKESSLKIKNSAKVEHCCSWCNKVLSIEDRDDFSEDTQTHGICEECELDLLSKKLPKMYEKLDKYKGMPQEEIIKEKIDKTEKRIEELKEKFGE